MKSTLSALSVLAVLSMAAPAVADSFAAGTLTFGIGVATVNPKSDNGTLAVGGKVNIGNSVRPTITAEYFLRDNLGLEVLAALPFKHSINIAGVGYAGSTMQLPPVISVQYHFANASKITPFVGAGLNYTWFFNEKSPLGSLKLGNSFGLAVHAGLDYRLSDRGWLRADVRWADIHSNVKLNGAALGKVAVNPTVFGVSYVMKF
ncbi:MAG: outer membrane beta-barrel protein [Rhodobacteraceae bacterium]|nr:outer membrane beta-barrel protein [Paracoccaceae bacterium]